MNNNYTGYEQKWLWTAEPQPHVDPKTWQEVLPSAPYEEDEETLKTQEGYMHPPRYVSENLWPDWLAYKKHRTPAKFVGVAFAFTAFVFVLWGANQFAALSANYDDTSGADNAAVLAAAQSTITTLVYGLGYAIALAPVFWAAGMLHQQWQQYRTQNPTKNEANLNLAENYFYKTLGFALLGLMTAGSFIYVASSGDDDYNWVLGSLLAAPIAAIFFKLSVNYLEEYNKVAHATEEVKPEKTIIANVASKEALNIFTTLAVMGLMGYGAFALDSHWDNAELLTADIQIITYVVGGLFAAIAAAGAFKNTVDAYRESNQREHKITYMMSQNKGDYRVESPKGPIKASNAIQGAGLAVVGVLLAIAFVGVASSNVSLSGSNTKIGTAALAGLAALAFLFSGIKMEKSLNQQWRVKAPATTDADQKVTVRMGAWR